MHRCPRAYGIFHYYYCMIAQLLIWDVVSLGKAPAQFVPIIDSIKQIHVPIIQSCKPFAVPNRRGQITCSVQRAADKAEGRAPQISIADANGIYQNSEIHKRRTDF